MHITVFCISYACSVDVHRDLGCLTIHRTFVGVCELHCSVFVLRRRWLMLASRHSSLQLDIQ